MCLKKNNRLCAVTVLKDGIGSVIKTPFTILHLHINRKFNSEHEKNQLRSNIEAYLYTKVKITVEKNSPICPKIRNERIVGRETKNDNKSKWPTKFSHHDNMMQQHDCPLFVNFLAYRHFN